MDYKFKSEHRYTQALIFTLQSMPLNDLKLLFNHLCKVKQHPSKAPQSDEAETAIADEKEYRELPSSVL